MTFDDLRAGMRIRTDFGEYIVGAIDRRSESFFDEISNSWKDWANLKNPVEVGMEPTDV